MFGTTWVSESTSSTANFTSNTDPSIFNEITVQMDGL